MKKVFFLAALLVCSIAAQAQRFALVDMEYILKQIPAYEQANQQMESLSKQWQSEVEAKAQEAKTMYDEYQKNASNLSATQKTAQENAIIAKEKEAALLAASILGVTGFPPAVAVAKNLLL